jgi:hypothetical protein
MSKVLVMDSSYETCKQAVDHAFSAFPVDVYGKKVDTTKGSVRF